MVNRRSGKSWRRMHSSGSQIRRRRLHLYNITNPKALVLKITSAFFIAKLQG
jgi:hypothetical protein